MIQSVYESLLRLQQAERLLAVHKYLVLLVFVLSLGVLPYLSYVYQVLPSIAALCLGLTVAFSLYSIFYYTKIRQQHRAMRFEIRFLEFHQEDVQYTELLLQEDHLWADSITYSYLHNLHASSHKNGMQTDPKEAFRLHFTELFPSWLNFSPAFLASIGWLILEFPNRLNPTLIFVTQSLHTFAIGALATALFIELTTTLMRYQSYQKAVHLEQWMSELATTIVSPVFVEKHPYPLARVEIPNKAENIPLPLIESKQPTHKIPKIPSPPHVDAPTLNELLGTLQQSDHQILPKLERIQPHKVEESQKNAAKTQPLTNDIATFPELVAKPLIDFDLEKVEEVEQTTNNPVQIVSVNPPQKALPISAELNDAVHLKTIGKALRRSFTPEMVVIETPKASILPTTPTHQPADTTPLQAEKNTHENFISKKIQLADGTEAFVMQAAPIIQAEPLMEEQVQKTKIAKLKKRKFARAEKEEPISLPTFQNLERLV